MIITVYQQFHVDEWNPATEWMNGRASMGYLLSAHSEIVIKAKGTVDINVCVTTCYPIHVVDQEITHEFQSGNTDKQLLVIFENSTLDKFTASVTSVDLIKPIDYEHFTINGIIVGIGVILFILSRKIGRSE